MFRKPCSVSVPCVPRCHGGERVILPPARAKLLFGAGKVLGAESLYIMSLKRGDSTALKGSDVGYIVPQPEIC